MLVEWLFLAVPWGCMRFVIVVFPDHTHLLFLYFITSGLVRTCYLYKVSGLTKTTQEIELAILILR